MVITIVPKCEECKTSKNVIFAVAEVKIRKTWFHIVYCTKCYEVLECCFRGRALSTKEFDKEIK